MVQSCQCQQLEGEADLERGERDVRVVAIDDLPGVVFVCRMDADIAVVAIAVQPNQQACHIPQSGHLFSDCIRD